MIRASSEPRRQGGGGESERRGLETLGTLTIIIEYGHCQGEHWSTLTLTAATLGRGQCHRQARRRCRCRGRSQERGGQVRVTAVSRGHELEVEWLRLRTSCGHQLPAGRTSLAGAHNTHTLSTLANTTCKSSITGSW